MLFFLIVLGIIILIIVFSILILLSTIRIEIQNLKIGKIKKKNKFNLKIGIYVFNKVKILSINLNNKKIKKIYNSKQLEKINMKKVEGLIPINKEILKIFQIIKINNLKLYVSIGTEDAVLTSYLIAIIAGLIGIILPHVVVNQNKIFYKINPIYRGTNEFNMDLDGIFSVKIVHIIYIIYNLVKKGSMENGKTSNRRSYAYSYGQY